jgi:epoxyqueuosine reductase
MHGSSSERIKEEARRLGFDLVGIAAAKRPFHAGAFLDWLSLGRHAGMGWMSRDPERRLDPGRVLPGARSVVVVGLSYFTADPPPEIWNDPARGRIARYAWGRDYHEVLLPMLEELGAFIESEVGEPLARRAYVDTGPVLEREVAATAGIGFVGKNTLLISPRLGSYVLLGEILLNRELTPDEPAGEGGAVLHDAGVDRLGTCGSCMRCQSACPTRAFPTPHVLDSRRCISYLTIEHRGSIPEELRPLMGNWIFGCDECQTVCPWVRQFSGQGRVKFLSPDPDRMAPKLTDLLQLDESAFRDRFAGSPVLRSKRCGLLRNAAIALGNSGSPDAIPALHGAAADADPLVREHANWALRRIAGGDLRPETLFP